jgi:hypothetical protein
MGVPYVGEALAFLKDPFTFTLERTRKHGNIWKTRILGDTTVFFAGPKAFSFVVLGQHPDLAAKVRAEADAQLAGVGPLPRSGLRVTITARKA